MQKSKYLMNEIYCCYWDGTIASKQHIATQHINNTWQY